MIIVYYSIILVVPFLLRLIEEKIKNEKFINLIKYITII